jgi:hypothetical protein
MKNSLHALFFICLSLHAFSQARLILNNGGIVNITNSAFVVIDNPSTNAITRNTSGHIISEGEFNRVKWNIGTTNGTYVVPFGIGTSEYLPVTLTTSGAVGATGSLTFAMYPVGSWLNSSNLPTGVTNFINNYGTDNSAFAVDRFWRIEPSSYTTKPVLANLQFTYRDPEWSVASNAIVESNLIAQRYNNTSNSWDDYMPGTVTNTTANTSTVASLPSAQLFTWWTLVDNRYILPIELTAFNAVCDGNKVKISWQTASESNNNYFEIERSSDAIEFTSILKINSQNPNSTTILNYSTIDNNPINGKSYYRLKQVDFDGKFSYSSIVVLNCTSNTSAPAQVSIFPNPATDNITVNIEGLPGEKSIVIYDVLGQEIANKLIQSYESNVQENINISTLANATYLVQINVNGQLYQIYKFVKK